MNRKKEICIKGNIFKYIRDDILTQKEGNLIKISGPDGTGKSTFLSILYIYLYKNFIANKFPFYPYYINLHFYDNIINEEPSEDIIKETMYKDLKKLKELVDVYPDMSYIIIIDGNENYFKTTLKSGKYFNLFIKDIYAHKRIVCIGEKQRFIYTEAEAQMDICMKECNIYLNLDLSVDTIKKHGENLWMFIPLLKKEKGYLNR